MHTLLFFAHGMQVEVPKDTVLCFNPISLSPERMSVMSSVHFDIGGIIFEIKKAVLQKIPDTFFSNKYFYESQKPTYNSTRIVIEDSGGLEFFPLIFDYIRRKYDYECDQHNREDAPIPYTRHLSPAQLQDFKRVFQFCLPGMFYNESTTMTEDTNKMQLWGLDAVQENNLAAVLDKKELLVESDEDRHALLRSYVENSSLYDFRFFLLNQVNRLSAGKRIMERFLLGVFSEYEATPERLCMLSTVFDPYQFGGRFFLIGVHNVQYTVFSELIERWLRISQRRRGQAKRPVHKRFEDFKHIVECLVEDLGMPINIQGGFHFADEYHPAHYLLDWAAWLGSWMAFAIFLEYFPELKNSPRFLVAGAHSMFHLGNRGPQFNDDLPFILNELLPYMSPDELLTAKFQFEDTKKAIENMELGALPYHQRLNIPRELVQTISDMLDEAIRERRR